MGICKSAISMSSSSPFSNKKPVMIASRDNISDGNNISSGQSSEKKAPPLYCPQAKDLSKAGTKWTTPDGKWTNYTASSATKVNKFTGAQWVGIKVGKIICLYETNEAVAFPLALEKKISSLILEPKGVAGWSALVGNRRFCKSTSVADCPYYKKQSTDVKDVYEQIKYAPKKDVLT